MSIDNLLLKVESFYNQVDEDLIKIAFIKKVKEGYRVYSKKGRNLGTYKTWPQAARRLRQIEFFKHRKASTKLDLTNCYEFSYSSVLRELRKNNKYLLPHFLTIFKKYFDQAFVDNEENAEKTALMKSLRELQKKHDVIVKEAFIKNASAIDLGNPEYAGKYLSEIIKFVMQRISIENRLKSMLSLKHKILNINENEIASKDIPNSAAMGQAITFVKHVLINHNPVYIRQVLNNIAKNLV